MYTAKQLASCWLNYREFRTLPRLQGNMR